MYATCIFCNGSLGRNEAIEHFPVGRRLAFDAAKGRLWVVCPRCARWNLTPLDARWEAIEEAEREYSQTKLRAATDNVGLAKLKEGTELVRIGKPLLPEFASWRYGAVFRRRHRRATVLGVIGVAAPLTYSALSLGGAAHALGISASVAAIASNVYIWSSLAIQFHSQRRRTVVRDVNNQRIRLSSLHVASSEIIRSADGERWWLRIVHGRQALKGRSRRSLLEGHHEGMEQGWSDITGDGARRALAAMLPVVNRGGATDDQLSGAVGHLSRVRDPIELIIGDSSSTRPSGLSRGANPLGSMLPPRRLAMEMALHEDDERRAMDGELAELNERWREAEEIAAISDSLLLPGDLNERLAKLKGRDL